MPGKICLPMGRNLELFQRHLRHGRDVEPKTGGTGPRFRRRAKVIGNGVYLHRRGGGGGGETEVKKGSTMAFHLDSMLGESEFQKLPVGFRKEMREENEMGKEKQKEKGKRKKERKRKRKRKRKQKGKGETRIALGCGHTCSSPGRVRTEGGGAGVLIASFFHFVRNKRRKACFFFKKAFLKRKTSK